MKQSIFVVEDDQSIREMLEYALLAAGYETMCFDNSEDFLVQLNRSIPALVVLDIMLPGEDGITTLKKLRQDTKTKKIPVIMLTAKTAEIDRIRGLDLGADDYISKPFSILEVISRIRAVLRRFEQGLELSEIRLGDISLFEEKRKVLVKNNEIYLTFKEFELLHYLMRNKGIVLSRDQLLNQVWGFDYSGETRTVDMHIKTLRQKLGDANTLIKTIRNVGYKCEE